MEGELAIMGGLVWDFWGGGWAPRARRSTVLLGLVLSSATVLLLPLDVANNEGYAGE